MRLFRSKKFWWLAVSIFLILVMGFGLYYFNLLQKFAPKQGENIFLIDDFEGNPRQNILGADSGTYQHYPSWINSRLTHRSYYQKEGKHLEIKYNQPVDSRRYGGWRGWCGYYTLLFRFKGDKAQYLDSTAYDYLCFWIKGKDGGEKFTVGLADQDWYARKDSLRSEEIGKYLKRGKVTTRWQRAVIPLDNYYLNRKSLASIGICLEASLFQEEGEGKGTVYIDNLAFVKDPRSLPGVNYPTQKLIARAKVTRPEEQVPTLLAFLQNLRKKLTAGKETVSPAPVHRAEVKLTPRPPSGSMVSKVEPSTPPEPKKTKIKEAKTTPQKPKEGIWASLIKRLKANWLGLKILGVLVLLGLSLVGGKKLYFFLLKKKSELTRKRFAFAHEIKRGLLPVTPPKVDGLSFGVRNISPPEVKGDFYDFIQLDRKKIALVVGHALGEGGNVLAYLTKVINYLRHYAPLYQRPTKLLALLNEYLVKEQANGFFATMIYFVLDLDKNVITISNAGHEPMILLHAQGKEVDVYNTQDRTPLGMIAERTFAEQDIQLASGDLILFHTCGVSKVKSSKDIPFGFDRLTSSVDRNRSSDPNRLINRILDELTNFTKGRFQDNELTLLAIRLE